ncbi:VAN3-binding protein [Magnolia sinica]|uniref:VAN3-binding protein n=1 Tax=Magnolia sinica TaxID=86752 RepID=UPI00265866B9|nr:VAN3-binding protein [Magnolia sinica]
MDRCAYHRKFLLHRLENIEEEEPASWLPMSSSLPPPETPTEPMEFLARSWSLSALELSRALGDSFPQSLGTSGTSCSMNLKKRDTSSTASIDGHVIQSPAAAELYGGIPPLSTKETEDIKESLVRHQALDPEFLLKQRLIGNGLYKSVTGGKTMGRWMKDQKEKKKEEIRTHNAQLHAATSVAGVAAAVAAIIAATATLSDTSAAPEDGPSKTSAAIATAAALVATHCVEIAEEMGADRDQILTAINSAVNVKTSGDIMTLTAGAATALRGAAALRARLHKGLQTAVVGPSEESTGEERQSEICTALKFVTKGGELLKRTRKGALHWKQVSLCINSNWQVVIKMKSKHMVGTFVKKKKSVVFNVICDIPTWAARDGEEGSEHRAYFAIKTADRLIEFECRNEREKKMWTEGILQMLHYRAHMNNMFSL